MMTESWTASIVMPRFFTQWTVTEGNGKENAKPTYYNSCTMLTLQSSYA